MVLECRSLERPCLCYEGPLCWNFIGGLLPSGPSHSLFRTLGFLLNTSHTPFSSLSWCLFIGPFESYTVTGCSAQRLPLPPALRGSH